MVSYKYIFNVNSPALPISKTELSNVIMKHAVYGYYQCAYNNLIESIKMICSSENIPVSMNPMFMYNNANNPLAQCEVVIQLEGIQSHDEFIDNVIQDVDNKQWTNFTTYSSRLQEEIKAVKIDAYKKFLWNYDNIDAWFSKDHIQLPASMKNIISTNFEEFKKNVLNTIDYESYIDSCDQDDIKKATMYMVKNGIAKLNKYKHELNQHISNDNKRQETFILKNPVISNIYLLNSFASRCKKDWPRIKFKTLDKKSLDSISLWEV